MYKYIVGEINDCCSRLLSKRLQLLLLRELKCYLNKRILALISDEKGNRYSILLQSEITKLVKNTHPNLSSYNEYAECQRLKRLILQQLHLSCDCTVLTSDEFDKCMDILSKMEVVK